MAFTKDCGVISDILSRYMLWICWTFTSWLDTMKWFVWTVTSSRFYFISKGVFVSDLIMVIDHEYCNQEVRARVSTMRSTSYITVIAGVQKISSSARYCHMSAIISNLRVVRSSNETENEHLLYDFKSLFAQDKIRQSLRPYDPSS